MAVPSPWRRITIVLGLMSADLACFAIADTALQNLMAQPLALALFHNRPLGQPGNTAIDVVINHRADFCLSPLLWWATTAGASQGSADGARATTTAFVITGGAGVAAVSLLQPSDVLVSFLVWTSMLFAVPTARQLMRLFLGKIGVWHPPTAIIGTSPMAEEVVPVLGKQLALGLKVLWVVAGRRRRYISPAHSRASFPSWCRRKSWRRSGGSRLPSGDHGAGRSQQSQSQ